MVTLRALVLVTLMVLSLQPFEGHCKKAGNKINKTSKKKAYKSPTMSAAKATEKGSESNT